MKKITILSILFVLLLTVCGASACTTVAAATPTAEPITEPKVAASNEITAEGKLLPIQAEELSFAQSGVVDEILYLEGDTVSAGDVIATLIGKDTVQAELAAAQLEQTTAQQAMDALKRNALVTTAQAEKTLLDAQTAYETASNGWNLGSQEDASDLEQSLNDYIAAEEEYRAARDALVETLDLDETDRERINAQEDLDREAASLAEAYADLQADVAANQEPLDKEKVDLLAAISQLEVARENQTRINANNLDPDALALVEAQIAAADAHLTAAESSLALYELRAPVSGTLITFDLTSGDGVMAGNPIAFLADTTQWTVETTDLAEIDIAEVEVGQKATVKLEAFADEEFKGTVTEIDPIGHTYLGDMTYTVTITLDEADSRFRWNMTATVSIDRKTP